MFSFSLCVPWPWVNAILCIERLHTALYIDLNEVLIILMGNNITYMNIIEYDGFKVQIVIYLFILVIVLQDSSDQVVDTK